MGKKYDHLSQEEWLAIFHGLELGRALPSVGTSDGNVGREGPPQNENGPDIPPGPFPSPDVQTDQLRPISPICSSFSST